MFTLVPYATEIEIISDCQGGAAIDTRKEDLCKKLILRSFRCNLEVDSELLPFFKDHKQLLYNAIASAGVMLLLLALQNLLDRLLPEKYLDRTAKQVLSSGTVRMERNMKMVQICCHVSS